MYIYQPVSSSDMLRFAKQGPGAPRCIRCGQTFHMVFSGGQLAEQRCGCGLVYRVESMADQDLIVSNADLPASGADG